MVVPAAAVAMAVAEGFNYCQVSEHLFLLLFSIVIYDEPSNPNIAEQCNIVNIIITVKLWILS